MKIAFISFEYPPETAFGGIATYVEQAATMLAQRGHQVEVFAGGTAADVREKEGIHVHRISCLDTLNFYREIFPVFEKRHREVGFDVVESPDYKHDGYWVAKKIPTLAHVMRLHSGTASSSRLFEVHPRPKGLMALPGRGLASLRAFAGACGKRVLVRDREAFADYLFDVWNSDINDRRTAQAVDLVISPSLDLLKFQMSTWTLDPNHAVLLPYVYSARPALLQIPVGVKGKTVGFFGQLSERKGLRFLGEALPLIFESHPDARFRFVGKDCKTIDGQLWSAWLRDKAGAWADRLEFVGQIPLADMASEYAQVDVCVFPSIWENFPNVCLEAMSAGRAVAGSWNGGMPEILDHGRCGLLFPPRSAGALARAVNQLLDDKDLCAQLGERARARVLACYSRDVIAPQQEELYRRAMILNGQRSKRAPG